MKDPSASKVRPPSLSPHPHASWNVKLYSRQPKLTTQPDETGSHLGETKSQPDETGPRLDETKFPPNEAGSRLEETKFQPDETGSHLDKTKFQPDETGSRLDEFNSSTKPVRGVFIYNWKLMLASEPDVSLQTPQTAGAGLSCLPTARQMNVRWVREIFRACRRKKVPFFFKQWG
ncbi:MAG: DUF5131 family protein, partial [Chthoniobacterales bacterium]